MTKDIFTLSPLHTAKNALKVMKNRGVRRAPVLTGKKMVGMVSERDLLHILPGTAVQANTKEGVAGMDLPVKQIMKTEVISIRPNDHLELAARIMLQNKIGGIPVTEEGKLIGMLTESDIFKALWNILSVRKGCRIIFEDQRGSHSNLIEYMDMCEAHECEIHGFLKYPQPGNSNMYFLSVSGKKIEKLLDEIWTKSSQVISVMRDKKEKK
jgi:acetoin utilization protein AcuB